MITEDGTGLTDADALIDVAYADAYHLARGNADWAALDDTKKETCIVRATDYFELVYGCRLIHGKLTTAQALSMPTTEGMLLTAKKAVAVIALNASTLNLFQKPTADADGNIAATQGAVVETSEKVDVITETIKYAEPVAPQGLSAAGNVIFADVDRGMQPLLKAVAAPRAYR